MPESITDTATYIREVAQTLRLAGFRILLAFSLMITLVIIATSPENSAIALFFPLWWSAIAVIALQFPHLSQLCARTWAVISIPMAPVLIINNGLMPATLLPLATIFPVMLLRGGWRLMSMAILAGCIFLVPLYDGPIDTGIWLRLCVTNVVISILIYALVSRLEKALVESRNKSYELKLALEKERHASATQSRFLATMSHEIRTPLNGILGLTDVVLARPLDESQRPNLEKIQRSGLLLNRILNDVLDLSKLNAGKLLLETITFDLATLIDDCVTFYQPAADKKGLTLTQQVDERVVHAVSGDPTRIAQVLHNLLSNAIKFTKHGGVSLTVNVEQQMPDAQTLIFCIEDTGSGIDASVHEHIFEAFTQASESVSREYGGTGLGLQIAKSLVSAMNGEIWVASVPGEGSRFHFRITLPKASSPLPETRSDSDDAHYYAHVLVVEDNEINQLVARSLLEEFGVTVDLAANGQKALDKVRAHQYDLVFMDLNMPVMDGKEATRHIRRRYPDLPVIALTAAVLEEEISAAMDAGMNAYITKPVKRHDLNAMLATFLKR
ncbi:response regulator [Alteromonas sp. CYL-A6]|uniref:response regulator n=1 Tax=Alteromonas nitratireducens TaxID=3390813 RepID=UPI0034B8C207